uniref:alpha-amylase n=1 Tax=Macrostomum lignano TaxID=282301 RepID=A0A1I8F6R2_9PLAT
MDKISVSLNTGDIVWLMKRVLTSAMTRSSSRCRGQQGHSKHTRKPSTITKPDMTMQITITFGVLVSQLSTGYKNPQCRPGRQVIVHLFEWRWDDIALECKRFLGPRNYCGVQVSPPNEHRIFVSTDPSDPTFRPWWSGTSRIYVDAVVNHMAMVGGYGRGSGGSYYNAEREDFPGVPFSPRNFNGRDVCPTDDLTIHDYRDAIQVRNCRLLGLVDLRTGTDYVQRYIAKYFNELISLGVAGFRIDAAKHMWPQDIAGILNRTHNLIESEFGPNQRPFVYQEVIDLKGNGEPIKNAEYTPIARVTEFNYGR